MTQRKIVAVAVLLMFAFGSSGFCAEHAGHDEENGAHHCLAACHAGCCSAILSAHQFDITLALVSSVVLTQKLPLQAVFIDGIKHPPKAIA